MQRVAFIWDQAALDGLGAVRIEVDGDDLAEIIGRVEAPYAHAEGHPDIAGTYVGLRPWQLSGSLREHFMGVAGSDLACGPSDKTVLLGCNCGEPGCWPLMAEVVVGEREIVWRSFEQPHRRGKWSYAALPAFTFDHTQYEAALAEVDAVAPEQSPPSG